MEQVELPKTRLTGGLRLIERVLHPLVIVAVSLAVAGGVWLSGVEIRALASDEASLLKLLGGALLLVLIAVFFQQQTRVRQGQRDMERHFTEASGQLDRMISALEDRQKRAAPQDHRAATD